MPRFWPARKVDISQCKCMYFVVVILIKLRNVAGVSDMSETHYKLVSPNTRMELFMKYVRVSKYSGLPKAVFSSCRDQLHQVNISSVDNFCNVRMRQQQFLEVIGRYIITKFYSLFFCFLYTFCSNFLPTSYFDQRQTQLLR